MTLKKTALAMAFGSLFALGSNSSFAADQALLDTLLSNGTITATQHAQLIQQATEAPATVDQGLLDVLLQNGAINQTQFSNLETQQAQQVQQPIIVAAPEPSGDDVVVKLDSKGFRVETADEAFKMKIGGRMHLDANFSANGNDFDPNPNEGVEVRRARLHVKGVVWDDFQYAAQFDFAGNKIEVKDLFVSYRGFDWFNITVGQQKQAMSMEILESSNDMMFTERSLLSAMTVPLFDRAVGINFNSGGQNWSAQFGAYGEYISNIKNEGWGVSSRVTFAPIMSKTHVLHLGGYAGYRGMSDANRDLTFKYESTHQSSVYFTKAAMANVSGTTMAGLDAAYMVGPFSIQGEYAHSWTAREDGLRGLDFGGYYVQMAWTLTGESRTYRGSQGKFKRLKAASPFSWDKGQWGAWELATRVDGVDLNSGDIVGGEETAFTLALNWYLNNNIRVMADYRYAFDVDDSAVLYTDGRDVNHGIHGFTLRTQLTF
ncbi:MAG: porin [Methyloprofundus sp.]|nr:porin [Methyloprofundus sp.]